MPLREEPFPNNTLHPFFDGLIPEGWQLDIAQKKKENRRKGSNGVDVGLLPRLHWNSTKYKDTGSNAYLDNSYIIRYEGG